MKENKNFRNETFLRNEYLATVESDKNPSFDEIRKKVAHHYKKPEEVIKVHSIKGRFGKNIFEINYFIYDNEKAFNSAVLKTKKQYTLEKKEKQDKVKADFEAKKAANNPKSEETAE